VILVNGEAREEVSALDRGLAYGDGVFRTLRARAGAVELWRQHFGKLRRDCARLRIECPAESMLRAEVDELVTGERDCVVKIIVTRGPGGRGYAAPREAAPTRIVATFPPPPQRPDSDKEGVRVRWCETRLAHQPALAGVKHLNRLENVLARAEWDDPDIAEGLMCDASERVVEGTMTNVFILEGGRLVTPPLDRCGVEGVQRERLLGLAPEQGIACSIEEISRTRLLAAEQIYLVNSIVVLWWVARLEARRWARADVTPLLLSILET
jgi:4-amino-4-deoxychorismate lyase